MFVVGKKYKIKMIVGDGSGGMEELYNCEILEAEGTLIKYTQGKEVIIINTASNLFVGAEPQGA